MDLQNDRMVCLDSLEMGGLKDHRPTISPSGPGSVSGGATAESTRRSQLHSQSSGADDDTNPLFISAVRIFLDFVREKHSIANPEKTCGLEDLILYLAEFQEEAKTKKGERYSPSTIRVIRYSLNRVIALGKNQQEMRPYPTQSNGCRRKRKFEENLNDHVDLSNLSDDHSLDRSFGESLALHQLPSNSSSIKLPERDYRGFTDHSSRFPRLNRAGTATMTKDNFEPFPETTQSVLQGVKTFRNWLNNQGFSPVFEICSPQQLNDQLVSFYRFARNDMRSECTRSSLQSFRFSISHYLKKQAGIDIQKDPDFETSREAYRLALENLTTYTGLEIKRQTFESTFSQNFSGTEWLGIPVDCIKTIYRSGTLSTDSALSLQRKVWFELTIFFRGIPCCPDQAFWTKNTFKVFSDGQGIKYVELNPDMYSRYGHVITRVSQEAGRIMVQRTGSPFCPVASFEMYLAALSPTCESLFPSVLGADKIISESDRMFTLYSDKPVGPAVLSRMMETVASGAKLLYRFSCLSVAETDHVAWMRALTALEIEHRCQAMVAPPENLCRLKSSSECPNHRECNRKSVIHTMDREECDSEACSARTYSQQRPRISEHSEPSLPFLPSGSMQYDTTNGNRFSWKKKLKMALKDNLHSSQSDLSDGSSGAESPVRRSRPHDFDHVFFENDTITNGSPVPIQLAPVKLSLKVPSSSSGTCPDKTASCEFKDNQRDATSSSWTGSTKSEIDEVIKQELNSNSVTYRIEHPRRRAESTDTSTQATPEAPRPAVKRILDLYRKASPSLEMEHLEIQNGKFNEIPKHPGEARISDRQEGTSQPIIVVRPQITIISRGSGPIDGALLKQRIFESIAHSLENLEWHAEINDAVERLKENSLGTSSQHSSSVDLSSSPMSQSASFDKERDHKTKAPELSGSVLDSQVRFMLGSSSEEAHHSGCARHHSDYEYSDVQLEEPPKLHIDESDEKKDMMFDHEEGDHHHGSHRRKAFLPTRHFE